MNLNLSFKLNISSGYANSHDMTDWIDRFLSDHEEAKKSSELHRQTLHSVGTRYWEMLCRTIRQDAAKLNAKAMHLLKSKIEINNRELIPSDSELNVDRLAFPAIRLAIHLDLNSESIKIVEVRKETLEGDYKETIERLQLKLVNGNEIVFVDSEGGQLNLMQATEYILSRFFIE